MLVALYLSHTIYIERIFRLENLIILKIHLWLSNEIILSDLQEKSCLPFYDIFLFDILRLVFDKFNNDNNYNECIQILKQQL